MLGKQQYSRYQDLLKGFSLRTMPHITIEKRSTDKVIRWENNSMYKLSFKYYLDPRYGWLIMLANPEYSMEFDIPYNALIRIPVPFNDIINEVSEKISNFNKNN